MKQKVPIYFRMRQLVIGFLCTVFSVQGFASAEYDLYSPDRKIHVTVKDTGNSISYELSFNGTAIIQQSALGLESTTPSFYEGGIKKVEKSTFKETWQPLFGKKSQMLSEHLIFLPSQMFESNVACCWPLLILT